MATEDQQKIDAQKITYLTDFVVTSSPLQFLILGGQQTIGLTSNYAKGEIYAGTEWVTALAMSPMAAKTLAMALSKAVAEFEKDHYKLPELSGPLQGSAKTA